MDAAFAPLVAFTRATVTVIVGGFALAVGYKLVTGAISTRGLLSGDDGHPSPNSVQLLMMTVAGAAWYLGEATRTPLGRFPEVPTELLVLVGGSSLTYVGTRAHQWFFGQERERLLRRSRRKEP